MIGPVEQLVEASVPAAKLAHLSTYIVLDCGVPD